MPAGRAPSSSQLSVTCLPAGAMTPLTDRHVDMFEAGIVDPAKVTRSALQNAASVASMVLTTDTLVADLPDKKGAASAGGPDYGDY